MSIKEESKIVKNIMVEELLKENPLTRAKSALFGADKRIKSFAIGTPDNPMDWNGKDMTDEERRRENNKRRSKFENLLKDGFHKFKDLGDKMGFVKISGVYDEPDMPEHSYVIINANIKDAKNIFKQYGQQSFIFGIKDEETGTMTYQLWLRESINDDFELVEEQNDITNESEAEQFFSRLHNFKFKMPFKYFDESISDIKRSLEKCSLNEDFYNRLDKQVYNKIVGGHNSYLNRMFLYESPESRKQRKERVRKSKYGE